MRRDLIGLKQEVSAIASATDTDPRTRLAASWALEGKPDASAALLSPDSPHLRLFRSIGHLAFGASFFRTPSQAIEDRHQVGGSTIALNEILKGLALGVEEIIAREAVTHKAA